MSGETKIDRPLTIVSLPPEILRYIFQMTIEPKPPSDSGICFTVIERSLYNFLLICHHWYEVTICTPELWSSWGYRFEDWERHCLSHKNSPLNLVLDGWWPQFGCFDKILSNALKSCAACDLIRKVHIRGLHMGLLTFIILLLTPTDEGIRHSSIESIALDYGADHLNTTTFEQIGTLKKQGTCNHPRYILN